MASQLAALPVFLDVYQCSASRFSFCYSLLFEIIGYAIKLLFLRIFGQLIIILLFLNLQNEQ